MRTFEELTEELVLTLEKIKKLQERIRELDEERKAAFKFEFLGEES